jgi:cellulase/cellobiase CelA1
MNSPMDTLNDEKTQWNLAILPAEQQRELTKLRAQIALIARITEDAMTEQSKLYSYATYLASTNLNNTRLLQQTIATNSNLPLDDTELIQLNQEYINHLASVALAAYEKMGKVVQGISEEPKEVGVVEAIQRAIVLRLSE